MSTASSVLLEVSNLRKHFAITRGLLRRRVGSVRAVDGVDLQIRRGETLGLVGESGSGKSTLARVLLRLARPSSGRVSFEGRDLATLNAAELRGVRRNLQMIFQDPYSSLNPRMRVAAIVREPLDIHGIAAAGRKVHELLERVGLDDFAAHRFAHELSGGQRQRVAIARALATSPKLVVADEPISALDVSIQAQIVNLLADLKRDLGLTYLFIAHDLSMVRHISDRVAVMYLGKIVEQGRRGAVFDRPLHPYTQALIAAIPTPDPGRLSRAAPAPLRGEIPSPARPPSGCRFRTRCPFATDLCAEREPELRGFDVGGSARRGPESHRAREAAPARDATASGDAATSGDAAAPGDAAASGDPAPPHLVACHHVDEIMTGQTGADTGGRRP